MWIVHSPIRFYVHHLKSIKLHKVIEHFTGRSIKTTHFPHKTTIAIQTQNHCLFSSYYNKNTQTRTCISTIIVQSKNSFINFQLLLTSMAIWTCAIVLDKTVHLRSRRTRSTLAGPELIYTILTGTYFNRKAYVKYNRSLLFRIHNSDIIIVLLILVYFLSSKTRSRVKF